MQELSREPSRWYGVISLLMHLAWIKKKILQKFKEMKL